MGPRGRCHSVPLLIIAFVLDPACQTPADPASGALEARPSNPTCVAPERPESELEVSLVRAFPSVSGRKLVALVQAPGGGASEWYLVEQDGRVHAFADRDDATARLVLDIEPRVSSSASETGLLGIAFHPDFPARREVFLSYTARPDNQLTSRIARFAVLADGRIDPGSEQILLSIAQPMDNHNGGQIAFGPDRLLYIGLGDGGGAGDPLRTAQDTSSLLGKILRIDISGREGGRPYRIPPDNPYAGGGGRPESYALGLRNPWRFSFDRATGALWVGDVGQDAREEIDVVTRGGNYGWSAREGTRCYRAPCDSPAFLPPVLDYGHDEGRSVTGGFVYRGPDIPALDGVYLFGDFVAGTVWGAFEREGGGVERREVVASSLALSSFAEASDGRVFALHYGPDAGSIHRLVARGGGRPLPARLSETGCFDPDDPSVPVPGLIPYDVNVALWSDGAGKRRWVAIPDGASIAVDDAGGWELPVGSVLVKEFSLGGRRAETRLLVRHEDGGWAGYSYAWKADQSDAELTAGGVSVPTPAGPWAIPTRAQCGQCHTSAAARVLGFRPAELDRAVVRGGSSVEQLDWLAALGWFDGSPGEPGRVGALPPLDSDAPAADRARAYLDVNCAHCHRPGGPGGGGIDLRFAVPFAAQRLCDVVPQEGDLGIEDARIVAPGDPARSILLARMDRRGADQMPPLATARVDAPSSALVEDWIDSSSDCPATEVRRTVVFLHQVTSPGQRVLLRGGIDHAIAAGDGLHCTADNMACAIPIAHRNSRIGAGDAYLDWYGREPAQAPNDSGTPTAWTTDVWPAGWGAVKTVAADGYGVEPLDHWGPHEWMLDVDMDCARTRDGWFEVKAYVQGGAGWEPDIAQAGAPYPSHNHLARCGELTRFVFGSGSVEHEPLD